MAHTFKGRKADIFFNAMFDRNDEVEFIDKKTGATVGIDVDDLLTFIEEEYEPYNKPVKPNEFVGVKIKNFFCNGYFGRVYDLEDSVIIHNEEDSITVRKTNGEIETAYFDEHELTEMRSIIKYWSENDGYEE